jgi:hypothetical protein
MRALSDLRLAELERLAARPTRDEMLTESTVERA